MKVSKIICSIILLLAGSFFFAEGVSMDSVFASLTSNKVTAGDFLQEKTAAKLKRPLKSTGKFIFCDTGVVWQTVKPFPSTMAVTKTSMIQTKPDGSKVVTDGSSNEVFKSIAATLSSIFSGSKENLEQYFNIEKFETTASSWKMILSPKDKTIAAALKSIEIGGALTTGSGAGAAGSGAAASGAVAASMDFMKITQSETEATTYTLSNQVYRQELTDAEKALFK